MKNIMRPILVAFLLIGGVFVAGCAEKSEGDAEKAEPAKLIEVPGSEIKQIALTKKAAERIGLQMAPIVDSGGTKVAPYSAIVYDANGGTWVYTSPKELTFVRTPVTVASISGQDARLASGPEAGTQVVTVGSAELYGTENEIGH